MSDDRAHGNIRQQNHPRSATKLSIYPAWKIAKTLGQRTAAFDGDPALTMNL
jgi:hypothetical protein